MPAREKLWELHKFGGTCMEVVMNRFQARVHAIYLYMQKLNY